MRDVLQRQNLDLYDRGICYFDIITVPWLFIMNILIVIIHTWAKLNHENSLPTRFDRFACFSRCPYLLVLFILNELSCSHQSKLFQSYCAFPPDRLFNQKKLLSKGCPICNACVVYRHRRGLLLLHKSISLSSFYFDVTYVLSVTLFKCIWGDIYFIRFLMPDCITIYIK